MRGEKCKFMHPKLCWEAMRGHECAKKNCNFLHPYGLKNSSNSLKLDDADNQNHRNVPNAWQESSGGQRVTPKNQGLVKNRQPLNMNIIN